jgi:hypothetical protein
MIGFNDWVEAEQYGFVSREKGMSVVATHIQNVEESAVVNTIDGLRTWNFEMRVYTSDNSHYTAIASTRTYHVNSKAVEVYKLSDILGFFLNKE